MKVTKYSSKPIEELTSGEEKKSEKEEKKEE
jgi:hypothetical protein